MCDCIYGNRSKSHMGSYEIIDFTDFKTLYPAKDCEYVMKLTQKVDHFTVFKSLPSTLVAAHISFRQIT